MILGLDLSLSCTGFSVLTFNKQIVEYGTIRTEKADFYNDIERLRFIANEIEKIIQKYKIGIVVLEDSIPVKNSRSVLQVNVLKGMVIRTIQYQKHEIELNLLYPTTVKKLVTGNGRADKETVANTVKEQLGLELEYSDKQNKKKTSDIFDSLALSLSYIKEKGGMSND